MTAVSAGAVPRRVQAEALRPSNGFAYEFYAQQPQEKIDYIQYDVVIAYNGEFHYTPTVIADKNFASNFCVRTSLDLVEKSKAYLNMAGRFDGDIEADMSRAIDRLEAVTAEYMRPWADRAVGATTPAPGPGPTPDAGGGGEESAFEGAGTVDGPQCPPAISEKVDVPGEEKKQDIYKCPSKDCKEVFKRTPEYRDHFWIDHLGKKIFCPKCHEVFNRTSSRNRHVKECKGKGREAIIPCPDCPEKFKSKNALRTHRTKMHGRGTYTCKECDAKFTTKDYLKRHTIKMHMESERKIPCSDATCNKKFREKRNMELHYNAAHSEAPSFQCHLCKDRKLTTARNLEIHLQWHETRAQDVLDDEDLERNIPFKTEPGSLPEAPQEEGEVITIGSTTETETTTTDDD